MAIAAAKVLTDKTSVNETFGKLTQFAPPPANKDRSSVSVDFVTGPSSMESGTVYELRKKDGNLIKLSDKEKSTFPPEGQPGVKVASPFGDGQTYYKFRRTDAQGTEHFFYADDKKYASYLKEQTYLKTVSKVKTAGSKFEKETLGGQKGETKKVDSSKAKVEGDKIQTTEKEIKPSFSTATIEGTQLKKGMLIVNGTTTTGKTGFASYTVIKAPEKLSEADKKYLDGYSTMKVNGQTYYVAPSVKANFEKQVEIKK